MNSDSTIKSDFYPKSSEDSEFDETPIRPKFNLFSATVPPIQLKETSPLGLKQEMIVPETSLRVNSETTMVDSFEQYANTTIVSGQVDSTLDDPLFKNLSRISNNTLYHSRRNTIDMRKTWTDNLGGSTEELRSPFKAAV